MRKEHVSKSLRLVSEYVRCGKRNCRCLMGQLHGPYWYLYGRIGREQRRSKVYLGIKLPWCFKRFV